MNREADYILLGVEDEGIVTGLVRDSKKAEEWVMEVCRNHIQPAIVHRYLPQAGITATAYPGDQEDYETIDEEIIRDPIVSLISKRGRIGEKGVIDRVVDFVIHNMGTNAWLEGERRIRKTTYQIEAIREAMVNNESIFSFNRLSDVLNVFCLSSNPSSSLRLSIVSNVFL